MTNASSPSYVYGESYPIAMDAAPPTRTLSQIFGSSRTNATDYRHSTPTQDSMMTRNRIALDMDTALEDGQWEKLKAHLSDKISPEDMDVVENICRKGGDAPEPGEDRRRPTAGASDANIARGYNSMLDREEEVLRARHSGGAISEVKLASGLRSLRARRRSVPLAQDESYTGVIARDPKAFPHAGRLK